MPYADTEEQRQKSRLAMRRLRATKKNKREEHEAKNLEQKPKTGEYMTFREYQKYFPNSIFADYLEEKLKFEKTKGVLHPDIEQILDQNIFPLKSYDCKAFRLQISGIARTKDGFFCANHHTSCPECTRWYHRWKTYAQGGNPW